MSDGYYTRYDDGYSDGIDECLKKFRASVESALAGESAALERADAAERDLAERASAWEKCSVCYGSADVSMCICGGSGLAVDEMTGLRQEAFRLRKGIEDALEWSGNRWSEWGSRAETVAEILDAALEGREPNLD